MKNLLFFSSNQNKIIEIKKIFKIRNKKILSLNDLPKIKIPKETGRTFVDNAKIKSLYGFKKFNIPCFADDSGICIEALGGKPGVYSKRFQYDNGGGWTNLTNPGYGLLNPITYNNITTTTQFRVNVKENNGCTTSNWSPIITVPINLISTPLISHN